MAKEALSHAEVWDDSILQDSWNGALEEYKKYHSLAEKGEKVRMDTSSTSKEPLSSDEAVQEAATTMREPVDSNTVSSTSDRIMEEPKPVEMSATPIAHMAPQALLANVQSEELKNLMMSWYYAGYYTGLYEGKQQGYASAIQPATE